MAWLFLVVVFVVLSMLPWAPPPSHFLPLVLFHLVWPALAGLSASIAHRTGLRGMHLITFGWFFIAAMAIYVVARWLVLARPG